VSAGEAHRWWRMAHFNPKIDDRRRTPVDNDASGGGGVLAAQRSDKEGETPQKSEMGWP
jgi:hypothetical protein